MTKKRLLQSFSNLVWFYPQNTNAVSTGYRSDVVEEEDLASMRMLQLKKFVENEKIDIDPSLDLRRTDSIRFVIRNHRLSVRMAMVVMRTYRL